MTKSKAIKGPCRNVHKVPATTWKNWNAQQRMFFNIMYGSMIDSQKIFWPKGPRITEGQWESLVFNVAWTAAQNGY